MDIADALRNEAKDLREQARQYEDLAAAIERGEVATESYDWLRRELGLTKKPR
jgi:hypothetical protein